MSIGSSSARLALHIAFWAEPPTPMPRRPGGHQPVPSVSTVCTTQSATESAGSRLVNFALFSEPPPLGPYRSGKGRRRGLAGAPW
jgi:hypothetical protein